MSSIEDRFLPDESPVLRTRRHPIVLFRVILLNIGAASVLVGISYTLGIFWFLAFYAAPLAALVWELLTWRHIMYVITNRRLFKSEGVFRISRTEIPFEKVEGIFLRQSLSGKFFNYGSVVLQLSGEEGGTQVLQFLPSPHLFSNRLTAQWENSRNSGDSFGDCHRN